MKKLSFLLFCSLIVCLSVSYGQSSGGVSIGKGDQPANPKSILELVSQAKGLLIPRMTTEQRNAIFTEADLTTAGLLVYDSTINSFFYWDGTTWKNMASMDNTISTIALEEAKTLSITEGSRTVTVDLSSLTNAVKRFEGTPVAAGLNNQLGYDGVNDALYIYKTDKWVLLNAIKDSQRLSTNGTQLEIENGNSVELLTILGKTPTGAVNPDVATSKEGDTFLNTTNHRLYFFDGTTWKIINQGSIDNLARTVVSGTVNPTTGNTIGDIFYNLTDSKLYSYNGAAWVAVGTNAASQTLAAILGVNTSAGNLKITNLANPVDLQDAATKNYVDLTVAANAKKWTNLTTLTYSLAADDYYLLNMVPAATPGPVVITLPAATLAIQGREFCVLNNNGTQRITFNIEPVGTIKNVAPGQSAKFICTGTYWFCSTGN